MTVFLFIEDEGRETHSTAALHLGQTLKSVLGHMVTFKRRECRKESANIYPWFSGAWRARSLTLVAFIVKAEDRDLRSFEHYRHATPCIKACSSGINHTALDISQSSHSTHTFMRLFSHNVWLTVTVLHGRATTHNIPLILNNIIIFILHIKIRLASKHLISLNM